MNFWLDSDNIWVVSISERHSCGFCVGGQLIKEHILKIVVKTFIWTYVQFTIFIEILYEFETKIVKKNLGYIIIAISFNAKKQMFHILTFRYLLKIKKYFKMSLVFFLYGGFKRCERVVRYSIYFFVSVQRCHCLSCVFSHKVGRIRRNWTY